MSEDELPPWRAKEGELVQAYCELCDEREDHFNSTKKPDGWRYVRYTFGHQLEHRLQAHPDVSSTTDALF